MAGRFPLLVDEHVPWALAQALRRQGWTVVRARIWAVSLKISGACPAAERRQRPRRHGALSDYQDVTLGMGASF